MCHNMLALIKKHVRDSAVRNVQVIEWEVERCVVCINIPGITCLDNT